MSEQDLIGTEVKFILNENPDGKVECEKCGFAYDEERLVDGVCYICEETA